MAWKVTGRPAVRQQRGRWVVRVDGVDTVTGRYRPRQLGTYTTRRAAERAATGAAATGNQGGDRGTVASLMDRWLATRTGVTPKTRLQYEWAAGHVAAALGSIRVDRLRREDVADWLGRLAEGGEYSRRALRLWSETTKHLLRWKVRLICRCQPQISVGRDTTEASRQ